MTTITFDESAIEEVLEGFDRTVDQEGFVFNPEEGNRETNDEGEEIPKEHFAGLERGSVIVLDDDFNTIVDHVKRRHSE